MPNLCSLPTVTCDILEKVGFQVLYVTDLLLLWYGYIWSHFALWVVRFKIVLVFDLFGGFRALLSVIKPVRLSLTFDSNVRSINMECHRLGWLDGSWLNSPIWPKATGETRLFLPINADNYRYSSAEQPVACVC